MLSESTIKYLRSLAYDRDAKKHRCVLPLRGLYWSDEIPDFGALKKMSDESRSQIYRLFRIRYALWDGVEPTAEDLAFLETTRAVAPDCPLFKRLIPTEEYLEDQKQIREESSLIYEVLGREGAPEVTRNKDGTVTTSWRLK